MHQRKGPEAHTPLVIHHLVTESDFEAMVKQHHGGAAGGAAARGWAAVRAGLMSGNAADRVAVRPRLAAVPLSPTPHQIFAAFDPPLAAGAAPLTSLDATACCAALGLPQTWPHYGPGKTIWRLSYRLPKGGPKAYVPTVADAGWREVFHPQPAGSRHGMTRGLLGQVGRAEVVHESIPAPIDFDGLPACLGAVR